jgi:sugar phosphate isomerase/epimerase
MARTLALHTGPWSDQPLATVAAKASDWGYSALDLACWGEHLAIQRALAEPEYGRGILALLEQHELSLVSLSNQPVGQAVGDRLDARHQATLPEWVWGDGDPEGVATRAAQEMIDTVKVAQQLGVSLVVAGTGSPFTAMHFGIPPATQDAITDVWQEFAQRWKPILDAFEQHGCKLALDMNAAQTAFDIDSAQATVDALDGHGALGFALNPAQLHWIGVDPSEFIRSQSDRLSLVTIRDAVVHLTGRNSLLGSLWPVGHVRRGWNPRMPGAGGVDWPTLFRTLAQCHFYGPLTVVVEDAEVDPDYAAAEAVQLVRRLDFPAKPRSDGIFG